jgi:hypothetical protein
VAMSVVVAVACVAARVLARGQGHGGRRGQDYDGALWEDGGREEGGGAAGMEGAAMVKGQRNASWRGRKRLMSPAGVVQAAQPWQAAASVHGEDGRSIGGFQSLSVDPDTRRSSRRWSWLAKALSCRSTATFS